MPPRRVLDIDQPLPNLDFDEQLADIDFNRPLANINFGDWCRHIQRVDEAITRLCDAIDMSRDDQLMHDAPVHDPPVHRLTRDAYLAVVALDQALHGAYSEDTHTSVALALTQLAVNRLLDALEPYVAEDVRQARQVLEDQVNRRRDRVGSLFETRKNIVRT